MESVPRNHAGASSADARVLRRWAPLARSLDRHERAEGERAPLGIILCADKGEEQVQLLELDAAGIHVAEYLTVLPPRDVLHRRLQAAIEAARARFDLADNG